MIVVSDTTPLNYLVLINQIELLPRLFDKVYVPRSVVGELSHPRAPEAVRRWAASLPNKWLLVEQPRQRAPSTLQLDAGEADAISLAKQLDIRSILIDESRGRQVATLEGLTVLPLLAVLESAAERGLIDLRQTLAHLSQTSFRVRPQLIEAALLRDDRRRTKP